MSRHVGDNAPRKNSPKSSVSALVAELYLLLETLNVQAERVRATPAFGRQRVPLGCRGRAWGSAFGSGDI